MRSLWCETITVLRYLAPFPTFLLFQNFTEKSLKAELKEQSETLHEMRNYIKMNVSLNK